MSVGEYFRERSVHTPLRLTESERADLRVLQGALAVSEYTDNVDVMMWGSSRAQRIQQQLVDAFAILSGLTVCTASKASMQMVRGRSFEDYADFFCRIFEVGRRHKIMNPSHMRATYGKLMHLLQDSQLHQIKSMVGFSCVWPVATVQAELEQLDALGLLDEDDLPAATAPLQPGDDPKRKSQAMERLLARYGDGQAERTDKLERCLLSIGDDEALTEAHVQPAHRMLELLHAHFNRSSAGKHSLAISAGRNGARLSHNHSSQADSLR